jgi:C-terminal processing protease CtpA/Prc
MKKIFLTCFWAASVLTLLGQTKQPTSNFNFGLEVAEAGNPVGWKASPGENYVVALDSNTVHGGKYSVSIASIAETAGFKSMSLTIPESYAGKQITLSGYLKTENVAEGFAGLWLRIDPSIGFDNMQDRGVAGTTDWTKYEITLPMDPAHTKQFVMGGLLVGTGKMWIDDLQVTIGSKKIETLKPLVQHRFPAEQDKEFDQGSKIRSIDLENTSVEDLKVLGLIWGFLKYYHPNVAKGQFNWDYELFRIFPKLLTAKTAPARDAILAEWITYLGPISEGKPINLDAIDIKLQPDLDWIRQSGFSDALVAALLRVKNAQRRQEHYYVGLQPYVKNPDFKNENPYTAMKYPDAGYRLLALYRYWNIIQYYFPYKNLIEEDWKLVLAEFVPKVIGAANETEYALSVLELIGRIHDTHANIWSWNPSLNAHFGVNASVAEIRFVGGKAVVTGFYDEKRGAETGLKIGDVVTTVNHRPVDEIVKTQLPYSPASNAPTQLRNIARKLLRTNDSLLNVEVLRNGKTISFMLNVYPFQEILNKLPFGAQDTCFRRIGNDIAYIDHGKLKVQYLPQLWKEIAPTKGLIIDIRNYPSDFPLFDLGKYLNPQSTPFVKFSNGSIETPGLFTFTKPESVGRKNGNWYKGKVVILVNELSLSSAEYHAMAYRVAPKATVIGSTTAGADGNVSEFWLPGGLSTMISGIGIYYPDGKETQRVGIVPDITIHPTIKGIQNGQDELLEMAIEVIEAR